MYYALRENCLSENTVEMIFDDEYKTVWIVW